jgi:hypothetical protein
MPSGIRNIWKGVIEYGLRTSYTPSILGKANQELEEKLWQ